MAWATQVNYRLEADRCDKPKVLTGLGQNGKGFGQVSEIRLRKQYPPGRKVGSKPFRGINRTWLARIVPGLPPGKPTVRKANGNAGKGRWRKPMPGCNGWDRGLCLVAKAS